MSQPTLATIKRLFAVSKNECAFPKCQSILFDVNSSHFLAEICHIKGEKEGAARFDPNQTAECRQAFENLIILCPNHHTVIDQDLRVYSVDRIVEMKKEHESSDAPALEPPANVVSEALAKLQNVTVSGGSVILNVGQTGGQVAHSITNIGRFPRRLSDSDCAALKTNLARFAGQPFEVESAMGDAEGSTYGWNLFHTLRAAGWAGYELKQSYMFTVPSGIQLIAAEPTPALNALAGELTKLGQPTTCIKDAGFKVPRIIVGTA